MLEVFLRSAQSDWWVRGSPRYPVASVPEESLPFSKWKMAQAREVLASDIPPEYRHAWNFMKGDHWQGGWGWAGPMVSTDNPSYQTLWSEILKMFCSRNVIREIVKTHVNGILGRPMRWALVPVRAAADERTATPDALKTLIAEASAIVQAWLESRRAHELMRSFLTDLLLPPGRAELRLFLPSGGGQPIASGSRILQLSNGKDFAQTMAQIYVEKPTVPNARVWVDPDTQREIGVAIFRAKTASGQGYQDAANLTFLDQTGERTMVGALYEDGTQTAVGYEMGGRLTMYEATRDPLITQQLLQQQRILNYAESMIPRNLTTSGFLDRVISSAQLNGEWVTDPTTGVETWVMDEASVPRFGPGEVTILQPLVIEDEAGRLTVTNPSMTRGDPVVPDGSMKSSDHLYYNMLRESEQGHLVPNEENNSLVIRFGLSLLESAIPVTGAFRWLIESALAWGEALQGTPGKYTEQLRPSVSCFVNIGSVTPEQRNALIAAFEKSIISRETAQELMGVEDVDSENDRIAAQPGSAIDLAIRQANAWKMYRDGGLPAGIAGKLSGFTPEQAAEMESEFQKQQTSDNAVKQQQLQLQGANAANVAGIRNKSQGSAGLNARRRGRPSGTAESNPGQQQDRGARVLQNKKRNRSQP